MSYDNWKCTHTTDPAPPTPPDGYGTCAICGEDCTEADYDPRTRTSTHRACALRTQGVSEPEDIWGPEAA